MACPTCGSEAKPLVVQRFIRRSVTNAFYHCSEQGCDFSTWDREDFAYEPTPPSLLEAVDVTWPPIRLLSNPRPVNWERE